MAYYTTSGLPKMRGKAMQALILDGKQVIPTANHFGVNRTTIWRWKKKWQSQNQHIQFVNFNRPNRSQGKVFRMHDVKWDIPTMSCRPHHHPKQIPEDVCRRVRELRKHGSGKKTKCCAELIWYNLQREDIKISLHSVKRILERSGAYRPEKNHSHPYNKNEKRPLANAPGDLVQMDTVHLINPFDYSKRSFVFTIIDVYTRTTFAYTTPNITQKCAKIALAKARDYFANLGITIKLVQTDNGSEYKSKFRKYVRKQIKAKYRHTRKYHPNDNAHIERFNRTLREECIGEYSTKTPKQINSLLQAYLKYYNYDRIHLGLQKQHKVFLTPIQMLQR